MHPLRSLAIPLALVLAAPVGGQPPKDAPTGPVIRVEAVYPGAAADVVQTAITNPLQSRLQGLDGAVRVVLHSSDERAVATIHFRAETKADQALALVQKRVDQLAPGLPDA